MSSLVERIRGERKAILRRWFGEVLESVPKQSRLLIAGNTERFSNPIGFTLNEGIEEIFAAVLGEKSLEEIDPALGRIVKLRAIQERPDIAQLEFLLSLKKIVRECCGAGSGTFAQTGELLEIEDRIDRIALKAYGIYAQSREKILELQVNEMKKKTYMFRKLAGEL